MSNKPVTSDTLRGWLLQQPKPALIKVTVDGDVEELKPGSSWAKTALTVAALEPELIQCYDAGGKLLRATRYESEASPRRRAQSDAPALPDVVAQDPHAALLHHFASLLHRAYEFSTGIAFEKQVELTETLSARSDSIEQRLERAEARARRLQEDQVEDAYDRAEELAAAAQAGDGNQQLGNHLVEAFLSGKLQRAPNGAATNGAAKGKA